MKSVQLKNLFNTTPWQGKSIASFPDYKEPLAHKQEQDNGNQSGVEKRRNGTLIKNIVSKEKDS